MAAVDYFLQITGVAGESADAKHKGWIDVDSWSWGENLPVPPAGGGGGGGAGKVQFQDLHFVSRVSKASPRLFLACATGQHFKEAKLVGRKAGKSQQDFLTFTFMDVLVTGYQTGGSEGGDVLPGDQVSLNFAKIKFEYRAHKADGTLDPPISAGYDVKSNKQL
jgi:type VI secretion system secreted protein Hcp